MHLELSTPIEQIQLQAPVMNIVNKEKVACAKVTDAQGNPITLHIHTTANEDINDAGNRAYLDVEIQEAACLDIAQQLNEHVIQKVIEQHASPEWFNKDIPENVIRQFFESFVEKQKSREHSFFRLKTPYKNKRAQVPVYTVCEAELAKVPGGAAGDDDAAVEADEAIVASLAPYAGKQVCYEVQIEPLRFLKTQFRTSLRLVAVHHTYSTDDVDFTELILNNEVHREEKATIEKLRAQMEQQRSELCKLELLKEEVEKEVAAAMSKREDVDRRYNETMAQIQEMEALHNVENDVALAEAAYDEEGLETDEEDDEILEPLEGMTDCSMDELVNGTVTVEADEAAEALDSFAAQAAAEAAAHETATADAPTTGNGTTPPATTEALAPVNADGAPATTDAAAPVTTPAEAPTTTAPQPDVAASSSA